MSTIVKSNSKSFADYRVESGACRPSTAKTWQNLGYKTIEDCHASCEGTDGCKGFDVARPRVKAKTPPDQFACYLHFGNNMKGNSAKAGCRKQNDCSCYIKESSGDSTNPVARGPAIDPSGPIRPPVLPVVNTSELDGYIRNPGICTPGQYFGPGPRNTSDKFNSVKEFWNTTASTCSSLCNESETCMGFDMRDLSINQAGQERGKCLLHNYRNANFTNLKPIPYQYCNYNQSNCRCYIKEPYYAKNNTYEEIRKNLA